MTLPALARGKHRSAARRPYDRAVEVAVTGAIALLVGLVVGAVGAVLRWWSPPRQRGLTARLAGNSGSGAGTAVAQGGGLPAGTLLAVPQVASPDLSRRVLEVMRCGAVVLDPGDEVVLANPAARAMGVLRGGRLLVDDLRRLARTARRDGESRQAVVDTPRGRLGREPIAVTVQVAPLGETGYVALLLDDVTESRRLEAVRRDFVANVSHELKTPVGALTLLSEAVQHAADDPESVRRFAGRMQHESVRLGRLVQELIELSRLQGADPLPVPTIVSVDALVAEACDRTRLVAETAGITVVSGGERGLAVRGSEVQLVTALVNLVDNAVAYSPARTRVAIGIRGRGEHVEISVSDQGIGIGERDLERVFERFYRADPARSRATGGTGLGLAIVKHIATNHAGEVSVWSVEGSGSTFTLRLPAATPHADDQPFDEPASRYAATGFDPDVPDDTDTDPVHRPYAAADLDAVDAKVDVSAEVDAGAGADAGVDADAPAWTEAAADAGMDADADAPAWTEATADGDAAIHADADADADADAWSNAETEADADVDAEADAGTADAGTGTWADAGPVPGLDGVAHPSRHPARGGLPKLAQRRRSGSVSPADAKGTA